MFIAIDEHGERVCASKDLSRDIHFYCPICKNEVRFRNGGNNVPHFAHINNNDCDDFSHDMSEWHLKWQKLFPEKNREVVVTYNDESHRADVLCYGTVIEFQHSPISESEFWRRNAFYTSAGYKVVWIFDQSHLERSDKNYTNARLYYKKHDNGRLYVWKHPSRMLSSFYPQTENEISVFFQFELPHVDSNERKIEQVVWACGNTSDIGDDHIVPWGRFITSNHLNSRNELLHWIIERRSNTSIVNKTAEDDTSSFDNWNYDTSEWNRNMKKCFPKSKVNVEFKWPGGYIDPNDGKNKPLEIPHRADVYENGIAVYFQHVPISKEEFLVRNATLLQGTKGISWSSTSPYVNHVAWVFDVSKEMERGFLKYEERNDNKQFLNWKNPERILKFSDLELQSMGNVSIWLSWKEDDIYTFNRIKWEENGFKHILLSTNYILVDEDIDIKKFAYSDEQWVLDYVSAYRPYKVLLAGIKGGKQWQYICPRTKKFGLKMYGESGCSYCRYCIAIESSGNTGERVYCKYPEQIRELYEGHPGYECTNVVWFF